MNRVYFFLLLVLNLCLRYAISSSYTSTLVYSSMHPELEGLRYNNLSSVLDFIYSLPEYKLENPPLIYSYISQPSASFFDDNSVNNNYMSGLKPTSHQAHSSYSSSNYQQGAHLSQNHRATSFYAPHYQSNLYPSNKGQVYFDDDNEYSKPTSYQINAKQAVAKAATPSPIDLNLIYEVLSYVLDNLEVIQKNAVTIKSLNLPAITNMIKSKPKIYQDSQTSAKYHQPAHSISKPQQPVQSYKSSNMPIQSYDNTMHHQPRPLGVHAKSYRPSGPVSGQANHYKSAKPYDGHVRQYQNAKPMSKPYNSPTASDPYTPVSFVPFPKNFQPHFPVTAHTQYIPGVGRVAIPLPPNVIKLKLPKNQQPCKLILFSFCALTICTNFNLLCSD